MDSYAFIGVRDTYTEGISQSKVLEVFLKVLISWKHYWSGQEASRVRVATIKTV